MIINKEILDDLTRRAKDSPRLRMHMDLRNAENDTSQRMLNAIEPGTVMAIHRHLSTTQTTVCLRGHYEVLLYDDRGNVKETIDMVPGGNLINVPIGQWHSLKSLESGTVLFECMDGAYEPLKEDEVFEVWRAKNEG